MGAIIGQKRSTERILYKKRLKHLFIKLKNALEGPGTPDVWLKNTM